MSRLTNPLTRRSSICPARCTGCPASRPWTAPIRPGRPEFGTYYRFRQDEILPHLSRQVQSYFAYMFARKTDHSWLRTLECKPEEAVVADQATKDRNMWCTAGFFHAAGYTILPDGTTHRLNAGAADAVFSFDPIRITGTGPGKDEWTPDPNATRRFIFHVRDTKHYPSAATKAMKSLLTTLP